MKTDNEDSNEEQTAETRKSEFGTLGEFVTVRKTKKKVLLRMETETQLKAELAAKNEEIEKLKLRLLKVQPVPEAGYSAIGQRRPDFRELKELVSKFNPKDPTCLSAHEWINEINTTAVHYGWADDTKLHCARLNLEGSAKLWWAGVQDIATTWTIFSQKLVNAYPSARDPIFYHNQMAQRGKRKDETLEEYVYTQVAMGKRAGFEERVIVKYVINGLGDFMSRSKVNISGKINTIEELMDQLKWMEGFISEAAENYTTAKTERRKDKANTCFRCHQPGHKAVSCKMAVDRSCFNCGESGHMAKSCPKPSKISASRVQVVDEENNFIKMVGVGGMKLNALIDSGCKVSTIQGRFASTVGKLVEANTTLVGFGGRKVKVDKKIEVTVKLDEIEVPVVLNVVPNQYGIKEVR